MAGSETPIPPIRNSERSSAPQAVFQGTVTGVKRENGGQTVEIQGTQGRLKLQAEGEFQVGERIRVLMAPGGGVRLEKPHLPAGPAAPEGQALSYQMPGNLTTLKSVRAFEEQLVNWVGSRQLGTAAGGKGGLAQALGGGDTEALLRLPLPELLKRVLAREGGRDMLMQALTTLSKEGFAALMAGLEEGGSDPAKSSLMAMLRGMRRQIDMSGGMAAGNAGAAAAHAAGMMGKDMDPTAGPRNSGLNEMGAYWPGGGPGGASVNAANAAKAGLDGKPGAAGEAMPWMGRILERSDSGRALAFAGGKPIPPPAQGVDPMYRYLLDLGGRTLEVQSGQLKQPGAFVDFEMEKQGARMQARFLDPAQSLPAGLRTAFARESPGMQAAMQVSARVLSEFKGEPYFNDLVRDFSQVLGQSGRFDVPEGAGRLPPGQLPSPKEIDTLLRLFVAFPRDAEQPEKQAKTWGDALRDPKAMLDLLRTLKPEAETSLLRSGTPLRLAAGAGQGEAAANRLMPELTAPAMRSASASEDALVALLRKVLPEGFKSPELLDLARQASAPGTEGKEAKAAQFALQAFAGLVPREEELREGRPNTFYFYQNQDWKGLQITWERDQQKDGRGKRDANKPLKMRVETEAQHMGKVDVAMTVLGDTATLHFRNQFHDVQDILAENMPELQKTAGLLGVHIDSWTYAPLEDLPHVLPTAGWVRPASLDGGNLDLMG